MENAGVQQKQTGETASVVRALWDPFGFMQQMFGWGRSSDAPLFEVKETEETYVCKVKVNLTLPELADVAHAKAELDNGELTLVVPKGLPPEAEPRRTAAAARPESPPQTSAAAPEPESPPKRGRRAKAGGNGSGSAGRTPRRGSRTPARRSR